MKEPDVSVPECNLGVVSRQDKRWVLYKRFYLLKTRRLSQKLWARLTVGWGAKTLEGNCTQLAKLKQTAEIEICETNVSWLQITKVDITNLFLT